MNPSPLEMRLRAIEDELAIRGLAARFSDCANERDLAGLRDLWTADAEREIGPALPVKAKGRSAIVALLATLLEPKLLFIQMTHSGVIEFTGRDRATARFVERKRRYSDYRYLDTSAFPGNVLPPAGTSRDGHP